jgi:hypothetical protein
MDDLLRLADTKTSDQKSTLMHFIARKLGPSKVCRLRLELGSLEDASKVVVDQVAADFRQVEGQIRMLEGTMSKAESTNIDGDCFKEIMTPFHESASP